MSKKELPTLAQRLKKLFLAEKPAQAITVAQQTVTAPVPHTEKNRAFKAGAAVAFITPIGAYAGNTTQQSERIRAEQQFRHLDTSSTTTIN